MRLVCVLVVGLSGLHSSRLAEAAPGSAVSFEAPDALARLAARVGAKTVPIVEGCLEAEANPCPKGGLHGLRSRLAARAAGEETTVRVLHLGDSHIAADLISDLVRERLQARFGNAGRGLIQADQRIGYGGRRLARKDADWNRPRVVDPRGPGGRYGLFGIALEAQKKGAAVHYRVEEEDRRIELHYQAGPRLPGFEVTLDGQALTTLDAKSERFETRVGSVALPEPAPPPEGKERPDSVPRPRRLEIAALGPKARLYGLGFFTDAPGLVWTSIGPVGADTKVFLQLERKSFVESLRQHRPDLVVLMVGGNDAHKIRRGWKTFDEIEADHRELVGLLRETVPEVSILLLSPLDSGVKRGGRVVSKPLIPEMRDLQRRVADDLGIGFWDAYEAMGGEGAVARWARAKVMNADLIHPKKPAADLLGQLLADAILAWYGGAPP